MYTAWSVSQDEIPDTDRWNELGANDAHFYSFLGDNLDWQDWTPTWTGITATNAVVTSKYARIGNTIFARVRFSWQTGCVMTGTPYYTLPVAAHADYVIGEHVVGSVYIEDYLSAPYWGVSRISSATQANIVPLAANGTYISNGGISTTTPMTWTTNDYFETLIIYEAA